MKKIRFAAAVTAMVLVSNALAPASAQTVEKVADLNLTSADGVGYGGTGPLDRFTQDGTNLWFTTEKGGTFDAGTISRFDLVTHEVVQVASFDNNTGKNPESSVLVIDGEGFFTTKSGGAGNKGTIARIDLTTGAITVLYDFITNGIPTGATPRSGLTRIGDELYGTTSAGGISNRGTIFRYNLTNGTTSLVADLDGPLLGGQAFDGLAPAGSNAWYFTTFTGGSTFATTGLPLGAGTLGRLTFDAQGNPVVTRVADLTAGYEQFPGLQPTFVGSNSLYFGTTGPNGTPGALIRYDIDSGAWTNVHSFVTNQPDATLYGTRPGYSGITEWLGELYFINRLGGTSNLGAVVKFNIASNTVTKLADLDGANGQALGSASGFFGSGLVVEETNRFYIYYPLTAGGIYNKGSIIRVALPAPPIQAALTNSAPGELALSWTGGYAPFTIQGRGDAASGSWTNIVENVADRTVTLPAAASSGFFRVVGSQ